MKEKVVLKVIEVSRETKDDVYDGWERVKEKSLEEHHFSLRSSFAHQPHVCCNALDVIGRNKSSVMWLLLPLRVSSETLRFPASLVRSSYENGSPYFEVVDSFNFDTISDCQLGSHTLVAHQFTMPPKITTIPRFLLPQTGAIWRNQFIRNATTKSKSGKPLVLEKPTKFNPPSHGSKITKGPPRYQYAGPQMSEEERTAQAKKQYPNLMPPEGTFMFWFINNRSIHLYITMVRVLFGTETQQILIMFYRAFCHH